MSQATPTTVPHPKIVSRDEWLPERKALLEREKELTRQYDALNARRRRMPMVRLDKDYSFDTADGRASLADLFDGRRQLIIYHFMFAPDWDAGCPGCTGFVDALGDLSMLHERNTSMVLVSRAPLAKLQPYKEQHGWSLHWVSSGEGAFNYDFHATLDDAVTPAEYNYRTRAEVEAHTGKAPVMKGDAHGLSVFFRLGEDLFHTYSVYARGVESLTDAYRLLDLTPYGRQEDFEDSPEGWPQRPTYG